MKVVKHNALKIELSSNGDYYKHGPLFLFEKIDEDENLVYETGISEGMGTIYFLLKQRKIPYKFKEKYNGEYNAYLIPPKYYYIVDELLIRS